jgi:hypothetical protein
LPVWQALYEELGSEGFVPITVALDRTEDVRSYIEASGATHPSLIDESHRTAELYHLVNVPTLIWIDEAGMICRPHDSQYATDTFTAFHKKLSGPYLDMIRAWVRTGAGVMTPEEIRAHQPRPDDDAQLARVERAVAWHLLNDGRAGAAEPHFARACELAPKDWTIQRGSLPLRGGNPFGPEFFALAEQGKFDYALEAITPTHAPEEEE